MTLARFKDLCLDATDPSRLGPFWAEVLGLAWDPDSGRGGRLLGATAQHTIWVNPVPEPKTVKHRVHFDIYARRLADLTALGSAIADRQGEDWPWTLMADPEGGEYCAFLRSELPADRLHGLVVDCADPAALARWWGGVYGVPVAHESAESATLERVPGMPILTMDFNRVPEPKTVKNRVHWDVTVPDLPALIDAGARLLRPPGGDIGWHVLADPEGNEFCAFPP